ncbi:MAG: sulfatase-like hydrolase/transferase [Candidatus Sumerlaeia bacterium]|nr:sulfatase-like hydrolase/transferase [Candidatus Sumerlaeia bacterium]
MLIGKKDWLLCAVLGALVFLAVDGFNISGEIPSRWRQLKNFRTPSASSGFPTAAFNLRIAKTVSFYLFCGAAVGAALGALAWLLARRPSPETDAGFRRRFWKSWTALMAALLVYVHLRMLTLHPALFAHSYLLADFAGNAMWVLVVDVLGKAAPILLALHLLKKFRREATAPLRRWWWVPAGLLAVVLLGVGGAWAARKAAEKPFANEGPNVILIALDSLRPDYLSWKGLKQPYPRPTTPDIDRFLDDAVWFDQAFVSVGRTNPSWMCILTGCWPPTSGIRFDLPPREWQLPRVPTLAQTLQKAGYKTAWFLDNTNYMWMEPAVGFDEVIEPEHNALNFYMSSVQFPTILYYFFLNNRLGFYFDPSLRMNAAYRATYRPEFMTEAVGKYLRRMRSAPKFFQAIHLCSIHIPFCVSYPYSTQFAPSFGPVLNRFGYRSLLEKILENKELQRQFSEEDTAWIFTQEVNLYNALTRSVSDAFGAIIAEIKKAGLYDNSYIVLMADHGENLPEPGLRYIYGSSTHGFFMWGDSDTHVPLAIKFPNQKYAGRRMERLVRSVDIAPTLLDALGLPPLESAEGVSRLRDIETGVEDDRERWIYGETGLSSPSFFIADHLDYDFAGYGLVHEIDPVTLKLYKKSRYMANMVHVKDRMIRTEQWKIIAYPVVRADRLTHHVELFDLATDRNSCNDVSTSHPAVRNELFKRMWPFIESDLKTFGTGAVRAVPRAGGMLREGKNTDKR